MFAPSVTTIHAVRALAALAAEPDRWHASDGVAQRAAVPRPFLAKLLRALRRRGWVEARQGRQGGYRLAAAAGRVSLLDVIRLVEGKDVFHRCQLSVGRCSARRGCPLHPGWSEERKRLMQLYRRLTLARLGRLDFVDRTVK